MSYLLGAKLGLERLHSKTLFVFAGLSLAFVSLVALLTRLHAPVAAVESTLDGPVFGIALPVFSYIAFEVALARDGWRDAVASLSRHGLSRPTLARGLTLTVAALSASMGMLLAVLAVLLTRSASHPRWLPDLVSVAWIGGLTGLAYSGLFALGSLLRRGRLWLLLLDWLLGSGTGLLALPWPRGHARNLLGHAPVLGISQAGAALGLFVIAIAGVLAGTRRLPR